MERLQRIVNNLKRRDHAHTEAFFITEALRGYGHSALLGGQESADYLHGLGLDDQKIFKMQKRYLENPAGMREFLEEGLLNGS